MVDIKIVEIGIAKSVKGVFYKMYDFTLKGVFNANLAEVYEAFNEPSMLTKWLAPGNLVVSQFSSNFLEGGDFRVVFESPDGFQQSAMGTYHQIEHHSQISFTWRWDDTNDITKVDVKFDKTHNFSTQIELSQSGFHVENEMLLQQHGWMASLEKLSLVTRHLAA